MMFSFDTRTSSSGAYDISATAVMEYFRSWDMRILAIISCVCVCEEWTITARSRNVSPDFCVSEVVHILGYSPNRRSDAIKGVSFIALAQRLSTIS